MHMFNSLYIQADPTVLDEIRQYVTAQTMGAISEIERDESKDDDNRITFRFEVGHQAGPYAAQALARRFRAPSVVIEMYDDANTYWAYAEYVNGVETRGSVWEDCGGA